MNSVSYLTLGTEVGLVFLKLCYSFEELEILYGLKKQFLFTTLLESTTSVHVLSDYLHFRKDGTLRCVVLLFATAHMSS